MRVAAIDVGTNSVLLCIGEKAHDGCTRILLETGRNSRLGKGSSQDNELQPEAMDRTFNAIGECLDEARVIGAEKVRLVGTSALREATNRGVFIDRIRSELGVDLEPIPEQEEGRLSYLAVSRDPDIGGYTGRQVIVDVGGGSTETIFGEDDNLLSISSVKAGAVRCTDKFFKENDLSIHRLIDVVSAVDQLLNGIEKLSDVTRFVGVGGSAVNLARVFYETAIEDTVKVHGHRISCRDLRKLMDLFMSLPADQRRQLKGLEPERADIILTGAIILYRALAWLGIEEMTVSTRGLRHGLLYEMLAD